MSQGIAGRPVAISAHRGGREAAPPGTREAYRSALAAGADYVELDVRRTGDGRLVSYHGTRTRWARPVDSVSYQRLCDLAGYQVPLVTEIMSLLAGRAIGHLDLKETADVAAIIQQALDLLGPGGCVVTTRAAGAAAEIKDRFPAVPVALTLGGDRAGSARFAWQRARARDLGQSRAAGLARLGWAASCGADWAALHHRAARGDVLAECRRRGIGTIVWTVNRSQSLVRWLAHPDVDIVVTDRPGYAIALRDRLAGRCPGGRA